MKFSLDAVIDRMYEYKIEPHRLTPEEYGLPFDEVDIPARDGAHLYGWWIPATPAAPTLILLHGWGRNLARTLPISRRCRRWDITCWLSTPAITAAAPPLHIPPSARFQRMSCPLWDI